MNRSLRISAIAAGSTLLVAALVALGLWIWLGRYAPLDGFGGDYAPGPGVGAAVQPVTGSGGRPVYFAIAKRRTFDAAFTLHNHGRFAVTVIGLHANAPTAAPSIGAVQLLATTSATASAEPSDLVPFRRLRLSPGDTAIVVVRFDLRCAGTTSGSPEAYADGVRLRYSYLSVFTRTQTVRLPFAVTLRCVGGPPASP